MYKRKLISISLIISILLNITFVLLLYFKDLPENNAVVSYESTIESIKRAQQMIQQSFNETGKRKTLTLYNAQNFIFTAQSFMKDYDRYFKSQNINIQYLSTTLQNEQSNLMLIIGEGILGKNIDNKRLEDINKELLYIDQLLPKSFDKDNLNQLRGSFLKLVGINNKD